MNMLVVIFFILLSFATTISISFWTDRTLDYWLTYFKDMPVDVPFWLSVLVTILLNCFIFSINVISELIRFIL